MMRQLIIFALCLFQVVIAQSQILSSDDYNLVASREAGLLATTATSKGVVFSAMDLLQNEQLATLRPHASLALFPNPTSDFVVLQFSTKMNQSADFYLMNGQGEVLFSDKIGTEAAVSVARIADYPAGSYLLKLQMADGQVFVLPFRKVAP